MYFEPWGHVDHMGVECGCRSSDRIMESHLIILLVSMKQPQCYCIRSYLDTGTQTNLRDITSLRRRWPSSLFMEMYKRQADMETMCRACKREFDTEFGGGWAGFHIIDYHLELGQLWRCPVEWCSVWQGSAASCVPMGNGSNCVCQLGYDSGPLTRLHLSIPLSGTTSTLGRLDSAPVTGLSIPLSGTTSTPGQLDCAPVTGLSIPSSGTTSTLDRLDSTPVSPAKV